MNEILKKIKLEKSGMEITAQSGLMLIAGVLDKYKIRDKFKNELPQPMSNRGFDFGTYLTPIIFNFAGGGVTIADISRLLTDKTLVNILNLKPFHESALKKFLYNNSKKIQWIIKKISNELITDLIKESKFTELTFDIDSTMIESEKSTAQMTYKGFKGYNALLGFIAEIGICAFENFQTGNTSPAFGLLDAIKDARSKLPQDVKLKNVRSDSAGWIAEIINYCEAEEIEYTITADLNSAVKAVIAQIPVSEWKPLLNKQGKTTDREYAETIYTMNKNKNAHRLIIQRKKDRQLKLFEDGSDCYVISTNKTIPAQEVIYHHNGRGNAENFNKEVKYGFNLDYLPTSNFDANKLWFSTGILTYNLIQALKLFALPKSWKTKQISTIRWQLFQIAGKLVYHANQLVLKLCGISDEIFNTFKEAKFLLCT